VRCEARRPDRLQGAPPGPAPRPGG
jgi:hypothetical protein